MEKKSSFWKKIIAYHFIRRRWFAAAIPVSCFISHFVVAVAIELIVHHIWDIMYKKRPRVNGCNGFDEDGRRLSGCSEDTLSRWVLHYYIVLGCCVSDGFNEREETVQCNERLTHKFVYQVTFIILSRMGDLFPIPGKFQQTPCLRGRATDI